IWPKVLRTFNHLEMTDAFHAECLPASQARLRQRKIGGAQLCCAGAMSRAVACASKVVESAAHFQRRALARVVWSPAGRPHHAMRLAFLAADRRAPTGQVAASCLAARQNQANVPACPDT